MVKGDVSPCNQAFFLFVKLTQLISLLEISAVQVQKKISLASLKLLKVSASLLLTFDNISNI